jgi:uncharacterized damage-inducible protein DinB
MTIHAFLKHRLDHAYRELERSLAGVDDVEARWGADPHWRRFRHGAGLDGSIQGIVRHVAAWKHVVSDGLDSGTDAFPDAEAVLPHEEGWAGLRAWLGSGQMRLLRDLGEIAPDGLERTVTLEGESLPLHALFALMLEHDHYHAGQINLLRQQFARQTG